MHDYSGALHAAADLLAFPSKAADQATYTSSSPPGSPSAANADAHAYVAPPFQNCLLPHFLPLDLRTHQYASQQSGQEAAAHHHHQHQQACNEAAATWPSSSPPQGRSVVGAVTANRADFGVESQCFGVGMAALQKGSRDAEDESPRQLAHASAFMPLAGSKRAAAMSSSSHKAGRAALLNTATSSTGLDSTLRGAAQADTHLVKQQPGLASCSEGKAMLQEQGVQRPIPLLPAGSLPYTAPYGIDSCLCFCCMMYTSSLASQLFLFWQ